MRQFPRFPIKYLFDGEKGGVFILCKNAIHSVKLSLFEFDHNSFFSRKYLSNSFQSDITPSPIGNRKGDFRFYYCIPILVFTIKKKLPYSGAVIFLNFERPYPHTLVSLMIPNNSIRNFPNVKAYLGKRICVKGVFYEYDRDDNRGKIYNMTISSPSDIH